MANPEQGLTALQQGTGTWLDFDLAIPDFLLPVREAIDSFAQALIAVLSILVAVLDAIKAFAIGFLDPLIALIEALIELIDSFINDLRNAGFYLHGDWYLMKDGPSFRNLLGGYQAYERRMIQRLTDPRDPERPNISANSTVAALFFYASSDADSLMRVLNFIKGLLALFSQDEKFLSRGLGTVTNVKAEYGIEGLDQIQGVKTLFDTMVEQNDGSRGIRQTGTPDLVTIKWQLADAPGNFVSPVARLLPGNFLIEVSTEPNPMFLQYDMVPKGQQVTKEISSTDPEKPPQRVRGLVVDEKGRTLQVTGGRDQFKMDDGDFYNTDSGSSDPRVFAFKNTADTEPIPLNSLKQDGEHLIQKTFFVSGREAGAITPGQTLSYTIRRDDMPKSATYENGKVKDVEEVDTFYVRVRSVSSSVKKQEDMRFLIDYTIFNQAKVPVVCPVNNPQELEEKINILDRGDASVPLKVTFPNAHTAEYLECVLASLLVMVLSRPDLQLVTNALGEPLAYVPEDQNFSTFANRVAKTTGLEDIAKKLLPRITGRKLDNEKFWTADATANWRNQIYRRCVVLTNRLYKDNNPPSAVQKFVVEQCGPLFDFRLGNFTNDLGTPIFQEQKSRGVKSGPSPSTGGLTLSQAMQDDDDFAGIALNPRSVGTTGEDLTQTMLSYRAALSDGTIPDPYSPHFYVSTNDDKIEEIEQARQVIPSPDARPIEDQIVVGENLFLQDGDGVTENEAFFSNVSKYNQQLLTNMVQRQSSLTNEFTATTVPPRVLEGSVFNAPVIFTRRGRRITKLTYCRNAFSDEMYGAAATALQVAMGPFAVDSDGGWITVRVGQLLPGLGAFLDEILAWIKAIAASVESIAKAIRRFIEYMQSRIIELQMLIQRINAILQNIFRLFDILPQGAILPIVSQGTSGVLRDLVTAQNKPFDGPNFYGGGAVVVASVGPLFPSFVLDIFAAK